LGREALEEKVFEKHINYSLPSLCKKGAGGEFPSFI